MTSALERGLGFMQRTQLPSGRFPGAVAFAQQMKGPLVDDDTPFVTAFLAPALAALPHAEAEAMRDRAIAYLVSASEPPGLWRYWTAKRALDFDLDDTACASMAVGNRHLSVLAGANRTAIARNRDEGGRFKTWLRQAGRSNDVDSVVNANVIAYLGETPETRAAIDWLLQLVELDRVAGSSWYYLDPPAALAFAMARAAANGVTRLAAAGRTLCARLAQRAEHGQITSAAMTITASIVFGAADAPSVRAAARHIESAQRADGSWPLEAFYCGPEPPGRRDVFFGSAALTTALCLEALTRLP